MTQEPTRSASTAEVASSKRYFSSFSDDYHRAFEGTGRNPLHRLINRLFRRKTFQLRSADVTEVLTALDPAGKRVLDVGCGSGELSIQAARLGAEVVGIDVVEGMVSIARGQANEAGVAERTRFVVGDALSAELPVSDICLLIGVVEYYSD